MFNYNTKLVWAKNAPLADIIENITFKLALLKNISVDMKWTWFKQTCITQHTSDGTVMNEYQLLVAVFVS